MLGLKEKCQSNSQHRWNTPGPRSSNSVAHFEPQYCCQTLFHKRSACKPTDMKLIEHHRPSLCPEFCCQVRWLPDEATDCCMAEHHVQIGSWREDDEPGNRVTTRFAIRIQIQSCETWMPNSVPFQPILDAYSPRSCGRPFTLLRRRHFGISWLVFKQVEHTLSGKGPDTYQISFQITKIL